MAANKRKLKRVQEKFCMKKRKRTIQDWSNLHGDILGEIFKHIPFVDKLRLKDTCSSWHSVAKSHIKSFLIALKDKSPLLLMPGENNKENCLFDIVNKVHKPLMNMPDRSHCVGSSQGWLILLQDKVNLLVYHPLFDFRIHLPPIVSLPDFDYNPENLSEHWIRKAILWGDDPILSHNYGVAVIYGCNSKLAFARHGDSRWTKFESSHKDYCDVIFCNNFICALSRNSCVKVWCSSSSYPRKVMEFKPTFPGNIPELKQPGSDLYTSQCYMVESKGVLLLVVRCIGEYVNLHGELVREGDICEGENQNFCCPYMTKNFHVYGFDFNKKEWFELKDLGDKMLFVGGNQSMCLSAKDYEGCKENTIYFTDDLWDRMNEHYMYGRHDMGVFHLGDGSIKDIYDQFEIDKMAPAFWILPS